MKIQGRDEEAVIFVEHEDEYWRVLIVARREGATFERDGRELVRLIFPKIISGEYAWDPSELEECCVDNARELFMQKLSGRSIVLA